MHRYAHPTMDVMPDLRVVFALPPQPSARFRVRQVLMAFVRIQVSEPEPGVFVLNRAGVPRRLFSVPNRHEVEARARSVADELHSLGTHAFCERHRVPHDFLEATELPRKRLPRLHPLF
jgi:hypothetical protein